MKISKIKSEGIAALSYLLSSEDEAIVIDPRRDVQIYTELAENLGVSISHIFETHRQEDYVIGSLELQALVPKARIAHSKVTPFEYGDLNLDDQDTITVGSMEITCFHTPGHTDDSMCYVVADKSVSVDPIAAFTGDTLFVNSVGRTDLVDITKNEEMSRKLYSSLHEKILTLDDGVVIHPGHGSGSVCGSDIGAREFSTIGYERMHNQWLSFDEEEFVQKKVKQRLTRASYFKHCEHLNTVGPSLLSELPEANEIDIDTFEKLLQDESHRAIDIRPSEDFLESHIPGSISLSISSLGRHVGWALRPTQSFSFILSNDVTNFNLAMAILCRIGYDDIRGFLRDGIQAWTQSGRQVSSIESMSLEVFGAYQTRSEMEIIDVRESHEYDRERIAGSTSFSLTELEEVAETIKSDRPIVTICHSGLRAVSAASILKAKGVDNVAVTLAGLKAWKEHDFPLESCIED